MAWSQCLSGCFVYCVKSDTRRPHETFTWQIGISTPPGFAEIAFDAMLRFAAGTALRIGHAPSCIRFTLEGFELRRRGLPNFKLHRAPERSRVIAIYAKLVVFVICHCLLSEVRFLLAPQRALRSKSEDFMVGGVK